MVVVGTICIEGAAWIASGDMEPENSSIKSFRRRNGADLQVDVSDDGAFGESVPRLSAGTHDESLNIKRIARHHPRAIFFLGLT